MSRFIRLIVITLVSVLLLSANPLAFAQDQNDDLARSIVDLKQQLENDATLVESVKNEITAQIQSAESNVSKIEEFKRRIAADQEATSTAASRSAAYLAEFEKLQKATPVPPNAELPLADIENEVTTLKTKVEKLTAEIQQNEQETTRRTARRQELRLLSDAVDKRLAEIQVKLQALPATDSSLSAQASRIGLLTSQKLTELEKSSLTTEQTRYDVGDTEKVLRNQRDLFNTQLAQGQVRLAALEELQAVKRQQMAKQTADEAEKTQAEIRRQNPLLVSSYEINTNLAKRDQAIVARALEAKTKLDAVNEQLEKVQQQFRDTDRRIKTIGLTGSVGALLRKRKSELPSVSHCLSDAELIKAEMNDVQYEIFDVDQQRDELMPALIHTEIESAYGPQEKLVLDGLAKPIDDLIVSRKEKLDAVRVSLDRLFEDRLREIEYKNRVLVKQTTEFREYINERILWIRSNELLFSKIEIDSTDAMVFKLSSWTDALKRIWQTIVESPVVSGLSAFVILVLLMFKPRLRREVDKLGQIASRGSCDSFWPTARAFVLTLVIAIAVPLIPLVLGFGLSRASISDNPLFNALGSSLLTVAWFAIPFEILRRICRRKGLGNEHFDWPDSSIAKLRKNLGQLVIPGSVFVFFIALLRNLDQTHRVDLIERSLFVVAMLGFAYFAWRTFSPKHGIFDEYLKANERSWANQTSALWFGIIVALPISLAVLAIWGFYYTAIHLADRAFMTFVFAVVLETIRELLKRMILVQRRHVHIQAARRKRESQLQARRELQNAQSESDNPSLIETITELGDNQLDIDENAKQANKLISLSMVLVWAIGLWMIWTDVMPALKALDNYTLWPTDVESVTDSLASETAPSSATLTTPTPVAGAPAVTPTATSHGSPPPASSAATTTSTENSVSTPPTRITVRNLLVFLVISTVTLISARNLPSALEMLLLDHLPFDRSFRYAIKALISYGIVLVGLIFAFRALSIGWNNVQWLATALTFGLAFGLQEIFANFVAGIILMFERPIRIGDWVTVDDFTGAVTKIRTRATTIVNWDRKEYVIPNKDFITGRLINWTLSDAINRVVINVGVAYGSDVEKAKSILLDVCNQHPRTVDDPAPSVVFEAFGDSSLNLVCRAFLDEIECRPKVIDELHTQINTAFNEAGVVIAFPQRDLHISSIDQRVTESIRGVKRIQSAESPTSGDIDANPETV